VSQQILNIQKGLINKSEFVELMGMEYKLNKDVGIFITMNPGYAGRSELPGMVLVLTSCGLLNTH
jgi:dynein heavy chain 1